MERNKERKKRLVNIARALLLRSLRRTRFSETTSKERSKQIISLNMKRERNEKLIYAIYLISLNSNYPMWLLNLFT